MEPEKVEQKDAAAEPAKAEQMPGTGAQIVLWTLTILLLGAIGWGVLYYIRMVADAFATTFSGLSTFPH